MGERERFDGEVGHLYVVRCTTRILAIVMSMIDATLVYIHNQWPGARNTNRCLGRSICCTFD